MKSITQFVSFAGGSFILAACSVACATTLFDVSSTLSGSDPTQSGRLSRSGKSSIWTRTTHYPGTSATGTLFHYHAFTIPASRIALAPYLQISMDDTNSTFFVIAYDTAYLPGSSLSNNYVGDEGIAGNFLGNKSFFQVTLPAGHDLILVVNDITATNGGIGAPFHMTLEGFEDTQYTDLSGPLITGVKLSGTNLVLSGTNPVAAGKYSVMTSTNLTQPISGWTPIWTNVLGSNTNFTFTATNAVKLNDRKQFFLLQLQ
jgi:hypothetical protein